MHGNPINSIDPNGQLVWALPFICAGGGCEAAAGALTGAGLAGGLAAIWDSIKGDGKPIPADDYPDECDDNDDNDDCDELLTLMVNWYANIVYYLVDKGADASMEIARYEAAAVEFCQECPEYCQDLPRFRYKP